MDLLQKFGPEGVVGLLGGLLFASWIGPDTASGFTVLTLLAWAVVGLIVRGLRRVIGW